MLAVDPYRRENHQREHSAAPDERGKMVAGNERASYAGARPHINSLRRAMIGAVVALALLTVAVSRAAAASQDGTYSPAP
jgi:hypothetical protein